jgi:surface antigen
MIQNLGRALRRTAGGSAILMLGVVGVGSQPPATLAGSAYSAASTFGASAGTIYPAPATALAERTLRHDERAPALALKSVSSMAAAAVVARPITAKRPVTVRPSVSARATAAATSRSAAPAAPVAAAAGNSAGYAFGYCTWWVSHKRLIPWHGMAAQWWSLARAYGFAEGSTPRVGAVMVMGYGMAGASASSGHVGYVESVNPNGSFVISEMNWYGSGGGFGKVDYRTITSMAGILGFIY